MTEPKPGHDEDGFKKVNFDNAQMYLKHRIAYSSDCFGPKQLKRFRGRPFFEEPKAPDYAAPAPHLPGYL